MPENQLTITGYSTALFSTWYFVDELSILFDCGDGVCSGILQKSRKVKNVFISHADRDHLGGLFQFLQLNSRPGLRVYYPRSSGSFPAIADFSAKFDPQVSGVEWCPLCDGDEVSIRNDLVVRAQLNRHIVAKDGEVKSLSYFVEQTKQKLRAEMQSWSRDEIVAAKKAGKADELFLETRTTVLAYSGDTPIENDGRWNDVDTLIHEATFLTSDEIEPDNPRRNKHSSLDQVLAMVVKTNIRRLVLGHFSSRYDNAEIDTAIQQGCQLNRIAIPVFRVLPGEILRDVLKPDPL